MGHERRETSAHSPDFNVLDLGFFLFIQSLQYKASPRNIRELFDAATAAYNTFDSRKRYDTFHTLHKYMELSMKESGGNQYKLPHLSKARRQNCGEAVDEVVCQRAIYNIARNLANEPHCAARTQPPR